MSLPKALRMSFTACVAVYFTMVFWSLPIISQNAGGLVAFDLRPFGYSKDEALAFLAALNNDGLVHYLNIQHRLDLVFPALCAVTFSLAFFMLYSRSWAILFSAIAVLGACFDWAENNAVSHLLRAQNTYGLGGDIAFASNMTVLKSACITVAMCILLFGVARVLKIHLSQRKLDKA
jgi:hypothetical protein